MRKSLKLTVLVVLLLLLLAAALLISMREEFIADAGTSKNAPEKVTFLTYQGEQYPLRRHLQTVLLIGTDNTEEYEEKPENERDFYSYHQADFLMLLVLDQSTGKLETIQINRDTITDVPWLDIFGDYGGTQREQICLAFNYGDGGAISCKNTVNAVSSLLFGVPIQYYIQIPMVAIPQLNDLVGGVPVTVTTDMTKLDPALAPGNTVRLTGAQAETYVRSRMSLADDTNTARMGRQRDYIESFINCAKAASKSDSMFALRAIESLGGYLQSNMTDTQLSTLLEDLEKAELSPIRHADGELVRGSSHYEFYANEASQWEIIRSCVCK